MFTILKVTAFLIDSSCLSNHPNITAHACPSLSRALEFSVCIGSDGGSSVKCESSVYNGNVISDVCLDS